MKTVAGQLICKFCCLDPLLWAYPEWLGKQIQTGANAASISCSYAVLRDVILAGLPPLRCISGHHNLRYVACLDPAFRVSAFTTPYLGSAFNWFKCQYSANLRL